MKYRQFRCGKRENKLVYTINTNEKYNILFIKQKRFERESRVYFYFILLNVKVLRHLKHGAPLLLNSFLLLKKNYLIHSGII